MGLPHLKPGEKLNLLSLNERLPQASTFALIKSDHLEIIRMVLPKGKHVPEHRVPGEITVQCLEGRLVFEVDEEPKELAAGDWLYLLGNQAHSLHALSDCVVLVTILLPHGAG